MVYNSCAAILPCFRFGSGHIVKVETGLAIRQCSLSIVPLLPRIVRIYDIERRHQAGFNVLQASLVKQTRAVWSSTITTLD